MLKWLKSLKKKAPRKKKGGPKKGGPKKGSPAKRAPKVASVTKPIDRVKSRGKAQVLSRGEHGISRKNIDEHALKSFVSSA